MPQNIAGGQWRKNSESDAIQNGRKCVGRSGDLRFVENGIPVLYEQFHGRLRQPSPHCIQKCSLGKTKAAKCMNQAARERRLETVLPAQRILGGGAHGHPKQLSHLAVRIRRGIFIGAVATGAARQI